MSGVTHEMIYEKFSLGHQFSLRLWMNVGWYLNLFAD